ncbi:MAG: hypothetical protein M9884_11240 [Rhodocyclaceae bacterium]|nr:hypothetical protein [Rhodocyclaceae bacterium]
MPDLAAIVTGAAGDFLVVYNLGPGFTGANAYASGGVTGGNKSRITAVAAGAGNEDRIDFQSLAFPLASPDRRFHVVAGPVTYICDPVAQTLTRQWGYAIGAAQATPPAGGNECPAGERGDQLQFHLCAERRGAAQRDRVDPP